MVALGQNGQISVDLGVNFETALDISHLVGYTLSRTFVKILAVSDSDNAGSGVIRAFWGIGVYAGSIDNGDFPNLELGEGDWMAYGTMIFDMPGAASTVVKPDTAALIVNDFKSMRKIDRIGEVPFLVMQQTTSSDMVYHYAITQLLLMP